MNEFFKISTIYDVAAIFSFFTSVVYLFFFFKDRCWIIKSYISLDFQFSQDDTAYYCVSCKVTNDGVDPAYLENVTVYSSGKIPVYSGFSNGVNQSFYKLEHGMSFSFSIPYYDLNHLFERRNVDKIKLYMICRTQAGKSYKTKTISVKKSDIKRPLNHG